MHTAWPAPELAMAEERTSRMSWWVKELSEKLSLWFTLTSFSLYKTHKAQHQLLLLHGSTCKTLGFGAGWAYEEGSPDELSSVYRVVLQSGTFLCPFRTELCWNLCKKSGQCERTEETFIVAGWSFATERS